MESEFYTKTRCIALSNNVLRAYELDVHVKWMYRTHAPLSPD